MMQQTEQQSGGHRRLRDLERPSRYKDFLRTIARFQVSHPLFTLGILIAVTVAFIGGIAQVKTVASLEQMMPKDVPEIQAFRLLRDAGIGQDIIAVVIRRDPDSTLNNPGSSPGTAGLTQRESSITSFEYYTYVKRLQQQFATHASVIGVYSFADAIEAAHAINYPDQSHPLMDQTDYQATTAIIRQNPLLANQLTQFVNRQQTDTVILITTDVSADDRAMKQLATQIIDDVAQMGRPPHTIVTYTGTPIIQQRLAEIIQHDREITERISALFVFIVVGIVFGSLVAAIVPMISIILSIIWLYGVMGYIGLPISTLAGGVAAMVIGIGVDYAIHLRNKFEYERKKGESLSYAVEETMANTGYVLTIVTTVTALAFLSFALGQMPEMGRFGILMTLGVGLAFLLSTIGLPAFFVLEDMILSRIRANKVRGNA